MFLLSTGQHEILAYGSIQPKASFIITELAVDFHIYPTGRDYNIDDVSLLSSRNFAADNFCFSPDRRISS
jgi:hypothetical protein